MRFGPSNASSVDLCVRDLIAASRYRDTTTVVCCENETLFPDLNIKTYPYEVDASKRRKVAFALRLASEVSADMVVVQQHLPTAAALAGRIRAPVVFHKHNLIKPIGPNTLFNRARHKWRLKQYSSLAGMIFVSEFCRNAFIRDWPEVRLPSTIVYNGLDFSEWRTSDLSNNEIICVGRATPEKGTKEAALAVATVLEAKSDWCARFVLSEPEKFPEYTREVLDILHPVAMRVAVEFSQPLSVVRQRYQDAAIAIIPSKWEEPFGRTALEAHAAGCAVISSDSGGLPEINSSNALVLKRGFTVKDIIDHLNRLIDDSAFRSALVRNGRQFCQDRFSLSSVSAAADNFYEQLARERSRIFAPVPA